MKQVLLSTAIVLATAIPVVAATDNELLAENCLALGEMITNAMQLRDRGAPLEKLIGTVYAAQDMTPELRESVVGILVSGYDLPQIEPEVIGALVVGGCLDGNME